MSRHLSEADAFTLLKSITIPPRPAILLALQEEQRKETPDFKKLIDLIEEDPSLVAALLKTVNSPLYGGRTRIASVQQALTLLGLSNLGNILQGLALRGCFANLEAVGHIWQQSGQLALLCRLIAGRSGVISRDEAYLYGLFQHCGIPVLLQRFNNYSITLDRAWQAMDDFIAIEEQRHSTNHAIVGYLLARNWLLPTTVADAILNHHEPASETLIDSSLSSDCRSLLAIGLLAEHCYQDGTTESRQWNVLRPLLVPALGLDEHQLDQLVDEAHHQLEDNI